MTRHDTQTIRIEAEPSEVVSFLGDGANLPRWAVGFASAIRPAGDHWVVTTPTGAEMETRLVVNETAGTVDIVVTPAPGISVTAWTRVVPIDGAALMAFTLVQAPGSPDDAFDAQVSDVTRELAAARDAFEDRGRS